MNNDTIKILVKVDDAEAMAKLKELEADIEKAKTAAVELASLLKNLDVSCREV